MDESKISKDLCDERTHTISEKVDGIACEYKLLTRAVIMIEQTTQDIHNKLLGDDGIIYKINSHEKQFNMAR